MLCVFSDTSGHTHTHTHFFPKVQLILMGDRIVMGSFKLLGGLRNSTPIPPSSWRAIFN